MEWVFNDKVFFFQLTESDHDLPSYVIYVNVILQLVSGLLINSVALAYNAFVFVWCVFILYQVKRVSIILGAIELNPNDQNWIKAILVESHRIHVETLLCVKSLGSLLNLTYNSLFICSWRKKLEKYVNLVGAMELSSSTIMICFLLYLCIDAETRSSAIVVIMMTALYQSGVLCLLGQLLNTEVSMCCSNVYPLTLLVLMYFTFRMNFFGSICTT